MKIGDLLHWDDKPDLLAICIGIEYGNVIVARWVSPQPNSNRNSFHAYRHNFKKVRTE